MKQKHIGKPRVFSFVFLIIPAFCFHMGMATAQKIQNRNWIGLKFNSINEIPFFKKDVVQSSALLPNQSYAVSDYIKRGRHYVFLKKLLTTGSKRFKIIQALDPGKVSADEDLYVSGLCSENGSSDGYIIAIVKIDTDDEVVKNIRKAWRIEISKGLFTPVDPKKVTCINEGYGL